MNDGPPPRIALYFFSGRGVTLVSAFLQALNSSSRKYQQRGRWQRLLLQFRDFESAAWLLIELLRRYQASACVSAGVFDLSQGYERA